ncbi:serine-protein kinase ATM isoform X2 [Camponotus floridanus]|uniref:serine-protein kinase ATM isoform X2 n=2 Tax=Camponotus floridanus TaxID=104421 RepID=UPI000DC6B547|nr:serine-protein kinase ATM isoform X2 [Camponotus floridanus]
MSRISERISGVLKLANSAKLSDRKTFVAELLDLYRNDDALNEIYENTEKKVPGNINWPYIIHTVHQLILDEAEKPSKETTAKNKERQALCSLMIDTIRRSNERSAELLYGNDIISRILQILNSKPYIHYQDTYLAILVKYILPKSINHNNIREEQWKELLTVCSKLYKKVHLKKHIVLNALQLIVDHSFLHTNLVSHVKNLLLFLENVFGNVKANNDEQLTESFYKLSSSVCRQIATESRIALCKFSEDISMDILRLNGSEGKYNLLLMFLQIHHPNSIGCDSAYAYNWNKWRDLLRSMCQLVQENCKLDVQWCSFIEFASEVVKQIMDNSVNLASSVDANSFDDTYSQPTKRRRTINKMENVVDLITESSPEEVWSLVRILEETLRKYPQCLKPQDFAPLLQRLTELAQSRDEHIMDNLYNLAIVVMENEMSNGKEVQDTMIHWSKIWDMLLRSLGANQNEESGHSLIRCFIEHNKMSNANALLRLYLTKAIRWSPNSICTLRWLCERISLPEDAFTSVLDPSPSTTIAPICDRTRLLEWLLNVPWQKLMTRSSDKIIEDVCALLVNLVLSSRCRQNIRKSSRKREESRESIFVSHQDIYSTDLLQFCYASLTFKIELSVRLKDECDEENFKPVTTDGSPVFCVQEVFNFLKKCLYDIFQGEDSNDETKNTVEIHITLMKIAFLARSLSSLKHMGIIAKMDSVDPLIDTMEKHLKNSFEVLTKIDWGRYACKYAYLMNVTRALNVLYRTPYDAEIAKIIVSASTVDMLKNIFDLLNLEDSRYNSDYHKEHDTFQTRRRRSGKENPSSSPRRENAIHLQVVAALASFCALRVDADRDKSLQTKMMRNLFTMQQDFTNCVDYWVSLTILESLPARDQDEIHSEYANVPLDLMLKVCQRNHRDEEVSRRLLNLLPYFLEYAIKYGYSSRITVVHTLIQFYKRMHKSNYSVLVHVDYMKCVCNCVRIDPSFSWNHDMASDDDVVTLLDSILDYIGDMLFVLRSQAVRCLQEVLSLKNIAYKWKERICIKVEKIAFDLLDEVQQSSSDPQNNLEDSQQQDERETRTASALIALASIVCASGILQGRALYAMLRLTIERKVDVQIVRKILSTAAQYTTTHISLVEDNLNYLLTSWIKDAQYPCTVSLQRFPWILAGCETVDEFFKKYVNRIVPIVLRTSGLAEAVSFCADCAVPFDKIFEDVFPSCFAWLLSRVIVSNDAETMRKLTRNTDEFARMQDFRQLFYSRLQDVLVELIQRLHDEDDFGRFLSIPDVRFPAMDPPHFTRKTLDLCLDHLESFDVLIVTTRETLTCTLVEQQPAMLQKILLYLASAVHSARSQEDKLKRLYQYAYLCSRLTRDLAKPVFDEMAAFLIRDVCYSLLHMIEGNDNETLTTACCKFLDLFLRQALPARAAEVQDVLRFVVANLVGLAQSNTSSVNRIAANLLKFLVVEQKNVLREAIAKLSSFPNHEVFWDAKEARNAIRSEKDRSTLCLEDELEGFLDAISEENAECTLEDLANLTQQLSTRKRELKELHRKLERSYPEDGTSILHRLIFKLAKLTESCNPRVSMEATKCLGELGPTDSTVALRPAGSLVQEANYAIEILIYRSVAMLTNFLVEKAVKLRKVSADALYAILSTSFGHKLSDSEYTKNLSSILGESTPLKINYIRPFARGRCVTQMSFCVDATRFRNVMNPENSLWTVQKNENYADWIVKLTCTIAECFANSYLESFLPVCRLSVKFCELILPRIVYLVIHRNVSFIGTMCDCINQFFRQHFAINHEAEITASSTSRSGGCDQKIVRCMLDVVNHVRAQLPNDTTLTLDYVNLARAAHKCSAYYTALLFAQLACESISSDYPDFSSDPRIDYIYERQPVIGRVLQDIMLDTYLNISDPDATSGAGSSHLLDQDSRVQYYARTNCWDKVILAQDIELSYNSNQSSLTNARTEMANALHRSGLQFLQWRFLGDCLDERFSYECAWRLGNWDLLVTDSVAATSHNNLQPQHLRLGNQESVFHVHHYDALKCLHENDRRGTEQAIERARVSVIRQLRMISLESSRIVNEKLSQLRLLREIEQLNSVADSPQEEYSKVLQRWNEHEISLTGQFDYVEPILWQRITMFRIRESLWTNANIQEAFFATCLDLAKVAVSQGDFQVATRALGTLGTQRNLSTDLENQHLYQESLLAWMKHDQIIARRLLRNLIEKRNPKPSLKAKALRVYGDWMAETKSENPQTIIQKYYLESIEISEAIDEQTSDVVRELYDTQVALARFADAQYDQISAYMNSPIYESLKEYARSNDPRIPIVDQDQMKNQDIKRAVIISQKQSTNDAAELKNIEQEKRNYLAQALKYYLKTLCNSEEHNLLIFRLVALWLDNMLDNEVNEELLDELDNVPSFKFVPLVPQLAAHISNDLKHQRSFSTRIFRILERCALEHPYHTLPVVLALKNLHNDPGSTVLKEERRVLGAKKLLKRLTESPVRDIVLEMENLSRALLSLAYWQPKGKCTGKSYTIPRDQLISKIKNLDNVLLPTLNLLVRPSGNYDNVVGVRAYQETCEFVGGVTAPKKVICVGTDGVQRRQLVKGKDDLRQDAVMQQVFTVMNTLLRTCKETKQRNLRIRTYKVVPLTQRSGVLEWCDNTVPITATLIGNSGGIHKRYYPRDLTAEAARNKMKNVAQESNEVKLKVFLECCQRMRPAFHHFFEEKYRSPETWVEKTLTYTRSVATTSIAGYILGLGDRHLSNILIDEHTAEVVHIDFGVAFEQGKVLPLPETIPFRLTRDIEVAMGASGIEGTMRRSCEVTMTMLRDQRQIIITLLQVLLYDPLFTWAITPEKACKMQSDVVRSYSENSGRAPVETNKIAKRALLRIEQKLRGTEDGLVSSVPGQVERLLQEARDPANLCRVYCGWQPYLFTDWGCYCRKFAEF